MTTIGPTTMKTHRLLRAGAVLIACAALAAPAAADTINVAPGESIQDAVDSADPGDRVVLLPGVHLETEVEVTTPDLEIVGRRATIDGQGDTAFFVDADGVTIRSIRFVNCGFAIVTDDGEEKDGGDGPPSFLEDLEPVEDLVIRNNKFIGCLVPLMAWVRGNSRIESNTVETATSFILLIGLTGGGAFTVVYDGVDEDSLVIRRNKFRNVLGIALGVVLAPGKGSQATVDIVSNDIERCADGIWVSEDTLLEPDGGDGIPLPTDPALRVRSNNIDGCWDLFGILIQSDIDKDGEKGPPPIGIAVDRNVVQRCDDGGIVVLLDFIDDGGKGLDFLKLTGNRVLHNFAEGMVVQTFPPFVVNRNRLENNLGSGLMMDSGVGAIALENRIKRNRLNGVDASGGLLTDDDGPDGLGQMVLVGNRIETNGRDGVFLRTDFDLFDNRITRNRGDGVDIDGNTLDSGLTGTLEKNVIRDNRHHGVTNDGRNTVLDSNAIGNSGRGVHVDIAGDGNGGGSVDIQGNNSGSGGNGFVDTADMDADDFP